MAPTFYSGRGFSQPLGEAMFAERISDHAGTGKHVLNNSAPTVYCNFPMGAI
jgi:hypothetical protein